MTTRDCGECVACCVSPEIEEIGKPWKEPCPNLAATEVSPSRLPGCNNCTIYADRPSPCMEYNCAWIEGYGNEEDRPDRCGVLIDQREDVQGAYTAKALAPNSAWTEEAEATLRRMSTQLKKPLLVARYDDFKIIRCIASPAEGGVD